MEHSPLEIDAAPSAQLVQALSEKLRTSYVFPDVAERICSRLQQHLADGDYDDLEEAELLALALTLHMQEVSQDEHLWVRWHPEPLPGDENALHQNQEWIAAQKLEAQLDNYGFHRVERLPGNVGYVDIRKFHRAEWGGAVAVAAMAFLANASALIVDLRRCQGGYPGMVALVSSYLFGDEPVHLNSIYWRDEDLTQQYWTLPHVPGKRFDDRPVYVLTSKDTFSGGEEFAYNLQARQRATLVGEATGGGGHAGARHRLHRHFEAFIPTGRAINPVTQTNWQGCGVVPDVPVPQEEALPVAYRMALMSVAASIGEPAQGADRLLLDKVRAALDNQETPGT